MTPAQQHHQMLKEAGRKLTKARRNLARSRVVYCTAAAGGYRPAPLPVLWAAVEEDGARVTRMVAQVRELIAQRPGR